MNLTEAQDVLNRFKELEDLIRSKVPESIMVEGRQFNLSHLSTLKLQAQYAMHIGWGEYDYHYVNIDLEAILGEEA